MGSLIIPVLFLFSSIVLLVYLILPLLVKRWEDYQQKRLTQAVHKAESMFLFLDPKRLIGIYVSLPIILGAIGYFLFEPKPFSGIAGFILGIVIPTFMVNFYKQQRKSKFSSQLLDFLMILSSSLKGGLNMVQAFEIVAEEMQAPMTQEVSLLTREVKVGVSLEEALINFSKRTPSEELDLIVSAILVGRETGGDLTKVFSRLINTIRDRINLKEQVKTLTMQGRLQGIIMACLPVGFYFIVQGINPNHFKIMLEDTFGRLLLLVVAPALLLVGFILLKIFSKVEI